MLGYGFKDGHVLAGQEESVVDETSLAELMARLGSSGSAAEPEAQNISRADEGAYSIHHLGGQRV